MTAARRRELRLAATSTSTAAIGLIRALTDARPIKPTSTRCLPRGGLAPAEAPPIDAEILFRQPQPPHHQLSVTSGFEVIDLERLARTYLKIAACCRSDIKALGAAVASRF